ncbi:dnaJ homolog subfamily C member 9 [Spea bombifrons]|uniref:dnaJ homolog subfamily C member 9 n=1 Tax=Spea bombifrons TaxID=233779 RepID=UPI00234AC2E0|nr:dnaJ homolog subfamily C member 9 [Spea bombifrons]
MPGILDDCEKFFGTSDLYKVLAVRKEAKDGEIRRGYHKVSLQVHPDRVPADEKEEATAKFQILGKVYTVLSDKEQRALYDEQGIVDEEAESMTQDRNWHEYWRLLFNKITMADITSYKEKYQGSEEEKEEVLQAYIDFEGDMDEVMASVPCVEYTDEPRIRDIIDQAIERKEVPSYDAFVKERKKKHTQRQKRGLAEAKEAEIMAKELCLGEGADDLKALIQKRQKDRANEADHFLAQMEAKYCNKPKRGGRKTAQKRK